MYWFDPKTARLEQFAYTYVNSDGSRGLRFRRLNNFRRVSGLLLFDQENLGREDHSLPLEAIDPVTVDSQLRVISQVSLQRVSVKPI